MSFDNNPGVEDTPKKYKMCHVDADTILYQSAVKLQENYILVTHKKSGSQKEFKGVQAFYGRKKTRDGGWIGEMNEQRAEKGLPLFTVDDFDIEQCARVIESPDPALSIIEYGLQQVDFKVGEIKKVMDAEDYRLWIGGNGNYRYDVAHILPYKGGRTDKPLLYAELKEALLNKYNKRANTVPDGWEVDDYVSMMGWKSYSEFLKTGEHIYVIAYVDKDLKSIPCPNFNYLKCEEGISTPDIFECAAHFAMQCLAGDKSVDNIQGLPNVSKEFAQKYKVTQRGVGKATAEKILEGCTTPKELYERVVEAYKSYYGEDEFEFESWRGDKSMRTWLDMLRENAILLYMCRTPKEIGVYDIQKTLDKLGVEY